LTTTAPIADTTLELRRAKRRAKAARYREKYRDKYNAASRLYRKNNPDIAKASDARRHQKRQKEGWYKAYRSSPQIREKVTASNKRWRIANPDYSKSAKRKEYERDWLARNRLRKSQSTKIDRIKNPEKYRDRNRTYRLHKLATDPVFKLRTIARKRIWTCFRYKGHKKKLRTHELLGCTVAFFRNYIESLFSEGMTWDNHGDWHIDHIQPCCTFDLRLIAEQKKCFHYTNCQPLWRDAHLKKHKGNWRVSK